jgi:ABC-type nitrate/sulfonate/bicarbonate transport system substrate-binding protein
MMRVFGIILAVGLALLPPLASAQQKLEKPTVPLSDGLRYFPIYVARGADLFAKHGVEPDWVNLAVGPKQIAALVGDSADFLAVSLIKAIKAPAEGANIVVLGSTFDVYGVKLALSNEAMARKGITSEMQIDEKVKQMQGLTFGMSSSGSSTDASFAACFWREDTTQTRLSISYRSGTVSPCLPHLTKS